MNVYKRATNKYRNIHFLKFHLPISGKKIKWFFCKVIVCLNIYQVQVSCVYSSTGKESIIIVQYEWAFLKIERTDFHLWYKIITKQFRLNRFARNSFFHETAPEYFHETINNPNFYVLYQISRKNQVKYDFIYSNCHTCTGRYPLLRYPNGFLPSQEWQVVFKLL